MDTGLLGTALKIQMVSSTWTDAAGQPERMTFAMSSGGRTQRVDASFGPKSVVALIDNSGTKSRKILTRPTGGPTVDDPMTIVLNGGMKKGNARTFFVLDPTTVSFVKNQVRVVGTASTTVRGKTVSGTLIEIADPRATTKVYVDSKGDIIKAEGPIGIEMIPIGRKEALGKSAAYSPSLDLAYSTSIKPNRPIHDPAHIAHLRLRISGRDLTSIPSGEFQTVTRDGDGWIVDVHPPQIRADDGMSVEDARKSKPEWAKASMNLPSNSKRFLNLAHRITVNQTKARSAAFAVRRWVYEHMRGNAGIGVLRDANEVLDSMEGVCRDYAVLTVTLLRSSGIPARIASGIVNWDGTFYYHAWAEAWDGKHWIAIDSTSDDDQVSAAHIKLGEGSVEDAFAFTFLDKAKIEVLGG